MGWAGAAAQGAASLIGGAGQERAANDASNAQQQGSRDAMQFDLAMYNQGRQDNLNSLVTGNSAINQLARLYGLDSYSGQVNTNPITMSGGETTVDRPSFLQRMADPGGILWSQTSNTTPITFDTGQGGGGIVGGGAGGGGTAAGGGVPDYSSFYKSPDYQVAYDESMQAADRQAAATGGYRGGGHMSDVARLGANIGSQYFGNYVGSLMNIAGFGSGAAGQNSAAGQSTAGRVGQNLNNAANASASGFINAGNARANSLANTGAAFSDWLGQRQGRGAPIQSGGAQGNTAFGYGSYNAGWGG